MTKLAFIEDGEVTEFPVTRDFLKTKYPNTSFPLDLDTVDLTDFKCVKVTSTPRPDYTLATQKLTGPVPELDNDTWKEKWTVSDLSAEEKKASDNSQWRSARAQRNQELIDSDWTQVADAPVDKAAWATYRQELRDVTKQSDPYNLSWPIIPT
tara:strand:+ start:607 stop:1065 length:459 start_codon:yes stop_codon:yes gene_type:complete